MKSTPNDNLIDLLSHSKNYENHRRKIQTIMNKQVNSTDLKRMQTLHTFQNFRVKAVTHTIKQKQSSLIKDNDMMFQKLLKVNNRKNQTFNSLNTTRAYSHKNLTSLKKSLSTIANQNNTFARKLITTRSDLSQQRLMPSYKRHLEVKQRLRKYQIDEDVGVIPKKFKSLEKLKYLRTNSLGFHYGSSSKISKNGSYFVQNQQR